MPEITSPAIAELAGQGFRAPSTLNAAQVKSICASALRQAGYEASLTMLRRRAALNKKRVAGGKMTVAEAIDDLVALMTPDKA